MGIPITPLLKQLLEEIGKEVKEKFSTSIKIPDKIARARKASTLFEYFVLYNSVLALEPESLEIKMISRQGPSFPPITGVKYWKTIRKCGEILEPSVVAKRDNEIFNFWFDRPVVFKKFGSLRPDIVIRKGGFEFKDLSYSQESSVQLLKEGKLFAECGIKRPSNGNNNLLKVAFYKVFEGSPEIEFKISPDFIHPPLIIECKSFGAVFGNPQEYAEYAHHVAIVTPEKAYEPKKENLHIIRLENSKYLSNYGCREKLKAFYKQIKLILI